MTPYSLTARTPLGQMTLTSADGTNLTGLVFDRDTNEGTPEIQAGDPSCPVLEDAAAQLFEHLSGDRKDFDVPMSLQGTVFQKSMNRSFVNTISSSY